MKKSLIVFFVLAAFPALADEDLRTLPLDQQEVVAESEKAYRQQKVTQALLSNSALEMEHQCMKVVGDTGFCKCIARETPTRINFTSYVALVMGTREEYRYDELSVEGRQIFDATRKARDDCVSWKGKR